MSLQVTPLIGKPAQDETWLQEPLIYKRNSGASHLAKLKALKERKPQLNVRLRSDLKECQNLSMRDMALRAAKEGKVEVVFKYKFDKRTRRKIKLDAETFNEGEVYKLPFNKAFYLLNPETYGHLFEEVSENTAKEVVKKSLKAEMAEELKAEIKAELEAEAKAEAEDSDSDSEDSEKKKTKRKKTTTRKKRKKKES